MSEIQTLYNGDSLFDIRRKINENFDFTQQQLESLNTDPLIRFTANSGNETNGVADLLNREADGTTLTFKVGGQYPNLVYTNAKGETTEVSSLDPLYMQNLKADTYIILVNGTSTQITSATFHYQLTEPTEIENGDIWFNGNGAYQYLNVGGTVQWMDYPYTPIGEAQYRTDKIAFSTTYAYNLNKIHEASTSAYGLMRVAAPVDETDCSCNDASITPANLYGLANFRRANTAYNVDDKVGCPYHHNLQLKCTVAGTTSSEALDTKGVLGVGSEIVDGTVTWEIEELGTGGGAYVGQTIFSLLPLNEAGLHLLDGTVLDGNGIYKEFVNYIKGLDLTGNCFTTEADWQASVSTYGVCGKFVYNSSSNSVRLPKVTGILEGTIDANALGDLVEAGLPNITGSLVNSGADDNGPLSGGTNANGAFTVTKVGNGADGSTTGGYNVYFDASRSSSIYGKSSTVQPQTIKGYYYIVVATSTKTDIEVDIDNVVTDLNGKVNKSGDTVTGKLVFTAHDAISLKSPIIDSSTLPSSDKYDSIKFYDANNKEMGFVQNKQTTTGATSIQFGALKRGSTGYNTFELGFNSNDEPFFRSDACLKSYMAQMSMPSTKYVDLTLNASGSTYTAPANGWFFLQKKHSSATYAGIYNTTAGWLAMECGGSSIPKVCLPAQKGQQVMVSYGATGETTYFRFIYAEGSK